MTKLSLPLLIIGSLLFTLLPQTAIQISSPEEAPPPPRFRMVFSYGVTSGNILDTYKGTFTRDMVIGPPVVIEMKLSDEDLRRIEVKLTEIGFLTRSDLSYNAPPGELITEKTPSSIFYLKVQYTGKELRELAWGDSRVYPRTSDMDNLDSLVHLITEIIQEKPEFKSLPQPRGGYV